MIGKVEYLEKYLVAPPPSRDYYGLKILQDEVILYIWKISHGPHKTPISRCTKFFEFDQDKALQEDISRFFGEHFVNYVKSIAEGKGNTLLTLPRSSIGKIIEFLKIEDIVNLSSLSRIANVIFSDNFIWEALYRRHKRFNIRREEREYAMAYGWKQTFKEKQMAISTGLHKIPGSTIKHENLKMQHRLTKSISGPLKTVSKTSSSSMNSESVTPLQITQKNAETNLTKSFRNNVIDNTAKTIQIDKKINTNIKKINNVKVNKPQNIKSVIKEKSNVRKTESKHDVRESFSDSMTVTRKSGITQRNQKSVVTAKNTNTTIDITGKGKFGDSKKNVHNKSTLSMIKSNDGTATGQQIKNKSRSKNKTKTKALIQNNSNVLSTDKSFLDESLVMKNENFELAYLIEESLKRIRSPRTVFDYDFSYLRDSKTFSDPIKKKEETGKTISTTKDSKRDQGNTRLDRLSENSDSMTTLSNDSIINDVKANESDHSAIKIPMSEKNKSWDSKMTTLSNDSIIDNVKANESDRSMIKIPMREENKSRDSKIITGRNETIERVIDFNKNSPKKSPKIKDEIDKKYCIPKGIQMSIKSPKIMDEMDKKYSIPKGVLNSIDIMKSLKSSNPVIKSTTISGKNFMTTATNRFALKKNVNELRKDQII
ncbi:uncharacterized protein LOC124427371 [Vespa crabro]|uniref:uncharacterized protein LOC124427371 n=1 Tax=Vespa crabro TaxID=7445 RepID=UPI001F02AED6|nr:uncharacterized protein LOC124427371 [Vespa crabro]